MLLGRLPSEALLGWPQWLWEVAEALCELGLSSGDTKVPKEQVVPCKTVGPA